MYGSYPDPMPVDTQKALKYLETALELSCAAIVALESLRPRVGELAGELSAVQRQMERTIDGVRGAIAELRGEHGQTESMLAFGFVLGRERRWSANPQVMPRRTA
jgi:hypothetical protein